MEKDKYLNEYMKMKEIEKEDEGEYYPLPVEAREDKFLEQLNPERVCEYIQNTLRGKFYDSETGQWQSLRLTRKITEEGLAEIMLRVRSIINPNTVYSNLELDDIRKITIDFAKELTLFLVFNYKKYNLTVADIRKIVNFCANMTFITLSRGEEALTLRLIRTAIQTKELITGIKEKEKPKTFWEKLGLSLK